MTRHRSFCVRDGGGNGQLNLGTGIGFAPDRQLTPRKLGALAHARQSVVSGAAACAKNLRVNALSVIPDPQPKLPAVVVEVHLDPLGLCVPERLAQRLAIR